MGTETVQGATTDVVALGAADMADPALAQVQGRMSEVLYYIDQTTRMPVKVERLIYAENHPRESAKEELFLSDYREVGTIWVPFRQTTQINGLPASELKITSVTFNPGVADSEFSLPQ